MADILIRFDEFPASCDVCPFVGTNDDLMSDDYRYLYCGFPYMGEFVTDYEISRHPDCPLHELPEHGDLIDRDAALSHPFANGQYDRENANRHFIGGHESYKEWLEDLPVIVPASEEA